jgi:phosphoribosylanthranilate isomerase
MSSRTSSPAFIIKVCGVTTYEDAQAALDAGANALGFNFYPRSPRFLTMEKAAAIIPKLRGNFLRVGVFVHPSSTDLNGAAAFLDVAQIHGDGAAPLPTWRAIAAGTLPPPETFVEAWLLDSFTPAFGGSGHAFDWSLATNFPHRAIIAGGLDATNVGEAIRIAKPWGVDSCSRLESSPGRKDHTRVAAFVETALHAFHAREEISI